MGLASVPHIDRVNELPDTRIRTSASWTFHPHAPHLAQQRLGPRVAAVQWLNQDVRSWVPDRPFVLWHDRAVFHFLTKPDDRDTYRATLRQAPNPTGVTQPFTWLLLAASPGPRPAI